MNQYPPHSSGDANHYYSQQPSHQQQPPPFQQTPQQWAQQRAQPLQPVCFARSVQQDSVYSDAGDLHSSTPDQSSYIFGASNLMRQGSISANAQLPTAPAMNSQYVPFSSTSGQHNSLTPTSASGGTQPSQPMYSYHNAENGSQSRPRLHSFHQPPQSFYRNHAPAPVPTQPISQQSSLLPRQYSQSSTQPPHQQFPSHYQPQPHLQSAQMPFSQDASQPPYVHPQQYQQVYHQRNPGQPYTPNPQPFVQPQFSPQPHSSTPLTHSNYPQYSGVSSFNDPHSSHFSSSLPSSIRPVSNHFNEVDPNAPFYQSKPSQSANTVETQLPSLTSSGMYPPSTSVVTTPNTHHQRQQHSSPPPNAFHSTSVHFDLSSPGTAPPLVSTHGESCPIDSIQHLIPRDRFPCPRSGSSTEESIPIYSFRDTPRWCPVPVKFAYSKVVSSRVCKELRKFLIIRNLRALMKFGNYAKESFLWTQSRYQVCFNIIIPEDINFIVGETPLNVILEKGWLSVTIHTRTIFSEQLARPVMLNPPSLTALRCYWSNRRQPTKQSLQHDDSATCIEDDDRNGNSRGQRFNSLTYGPNNAPQINLPPVSSQCDMSKSLHRPSSESKQRKSSRHHHSKPSSSTSAVAAAAAAAAAAADTYSYDLHRFDAKAEAAAATAAACLESSTSYQPFSELSISGNSHIPVPGAGTRNSNISIDLSSCARVHRCPISTRASRWMIEIALFKVDIEGRSPWWSQPTMGHAAPADRIPTPAAVIAQSVVVSKTSGTFHTMGSRSSGDTSQHGFPSLDELDPSSVLSGSHIIQSQDESSRNSSVIYAGSCTSSHNTSQNSRLVPSECSLVIRGSSTLAQNTPSNATGQSTYSVNAVSNSSAVPVTLQLNQSQAHQTTSRIGSRSTLSMSSWRGSQSGLKQASSLPINNGDLSRVTTDGLSDTGVINWRCSHPFLVNWVQQWPFPIGIPRGVIFSKVIHQYIDDVSQSGTPCGITWDQLASSAIPHGTPDVNAQELPNSIDSEISVASPSNTTLHSISAHYSTRKGNPSLSKHQSSSINQVPLHMESHQYANLPQRHHSSDRSVNKQQ